VVSGAALSGIGFTVSLLIAGLAFSTSALRDQATVGVLMAAVLSALTGWLVFRLAAVLRGERTAGLPMVLDRPVDARRDHVRGPTDAPLTLVEYGDFECPFCGRATGVVHELRERFGDELRYVFRHLPLGDVHPHAELAAEAAEAAGAQGRFWEMHDLLFQHQAELETEDLVGYAGRLGLDMERFTRDLEDGATPDVCARTSRAPRPAARAGRPPSSSAIAATSGPMTPRPSRASSRRVDHRLVARSLAIGVVPRYAAVSNTAWAYIGWFGPRGLMPAVVESAS
jgi:protein-disulfide isomerase